MSRIKGTILIIAGVLTGLLFSGPATQAMAGLMANPSTQQFYIEDRRVDLEAYEIGGSNYVKLRDIGKAVDFGVSYDAATRSIVISPDKPYTEEVKTPAPATTGPAAPGALSRNADGSINVPQDGSQYVPQAGDVIRCDDGTNYTITDVSRYDGNMFASGPVGPLPTATCDWSGFDQPELPRAEVRHYNDEYSDRVFVRNLYEIRRILYTLYNAMGEDDWIWQNGKARLRSDGTPWVHIHYGMPDDRSIPGFWPWREELVTESLHASPSGDYYVDVWDVYRNGIYQKTEYQLY